MATAEVLLHPVRLRIVQALLGDRTLTATDLRAELPDVPPATLYRHLGALVGAEVIAVVNERRVRGTVERSYALSAPSAGLVPVQELDRMTPEQHRGAFRAFVAGLLIEFDRYTQRDRVDFLQDLVGYRQIAVWLTAEETAELIGELNRVIVPRLANGPGPGRVRRSFSTVLMPSGMSGGGGAGGGDGVTDRGGPGGGAAGGAAGASADGAARQVSGQ